MGSPISEKIIPAIKVFANHRKNRAKNPKVLEYLAKRRGSQINAQDEEQKSMISVSRSQKNLAQPLLLFSPLKGSKSLRQL
jgi:hypothetical protein